MRNNYVKQLEDLKKELILMGSLCENMLKDALDAFEKNDDAKASLIAESDDKIDDKESEIEASCLSLILHQQPVASDLRLISSSFKIITDLERIGDQASDIAEIALRLKYEDNENFKELSEMAKKTQKMFKEAIDSFVKLDIETAKNVLAQDDVVDEHFINMRSRLISLIEKNDHEARIPLDMLLIAKYLERIADHSCNVANWVIFAITGHHSSGEII